ncbi:hypothetical protein ACQCRO_27640 [Ralstonia pseudosolanacearum]|uniref:hypothetical protein n=1 Tax=Ralstonia pseudosolanacearum TaxID=1310165 RepID=UPI003CEE32F0
MMRIEGLLKVVVVVVVDMEEVVDAVTAAVADMVAMAVDLDTLRGVVVNLMETGGTR